MDYETWKAAVLNSPATRDATKAALRAFDRMDPCDAANDCAMLADMFGMKAAEVCRAPRTHDVAYYPSRQPRS
jgi:hypothetical protein